MGVREMEDRYRKMSKLGVRNIDGFNERVARPGKGRDLTRTVQTGFDRETGQAIYESESRSTSSRCPTSSSSSTRWPT
jgi:S-DNA-T family DNA segregation ATPase FtsK/SpoIIIE